MNYQSFIDYFDELTKDKELPQEVQEFYDLLKSQQDSYIEKPMFTESGLEILEYLQSCSAKSLKAKDIADGMGISSRKVSGSIRKLCADGYVDKFGKSPVLYSLTANGKEFNIENYKETLNKNNED